MHILGNYRASRCIYDAFTVLVRKFETYEKWRLSEYKETIIEVAIRIARDTLPVTYDTTNIQHLAKNTRNNFSHGRLF